MYTQRPDRGDYKSSRTGGFASSVCGKISWLGAWPHGGGNGAEGLLGTCMTVPTRGYLGLFAKYFFHFARDYRKTSNQKHVNRRSRTMTYLELLLVQSSQVVRPVAIQTRRSKCSSGIDARKVVIFSIRTIRMSPFSDVVDIAVDLHGTS